MVNVRSLIADFLPEYPQVDTVNMTPDEVTKAIRSWRLKVYKLISFCGVAVMLRRDKSLDLNKLHHFSNISPYVWSLYFTFALVCMLLGIIAASFPDTSPCAMALSSNGALQTFLYMIVLFHLSIIEFYAREEHMLISVILTSALFVVFWCFCSRVPQPIWKLHKKANHAPTHPSREATQLTAAAAEAATPADASWLPQRRRGQTGSSTASRVKLLPSVMKRRPSPAAATGNQLP